ncbi:EAL domain-containing protein [Geobacter sp. DSM 9736]|uniref:EAL domain-containing protein n=1 Tax=Geobacter sp. DSM 9736 TaxID=1277350 RepID=UPI000B512845|nr:EAL domain-containing protein [Geobacter sp. DSM 9736]SNB47298.1 PAS domain S-box-containing protein/diguanylate cyclase (GGDEF) domain-containing protein [Geobacter sp. DSM 9736]
MDVPVIHILLVEDNPDDAALIEAMLSDAPGSWGTLRHVERLATGKDLLSSENFDVVLLDLGLPDSQGLDTLRSLRSVAPTLPLILLTGLHDEELGSSAVEMGAQDYLVKGQIDANILSRAIRYSIQRKRIEETVRKGKVLSDALNNIYEIIDLSKDFSTIITRIIEEATRAIGADSAVIYLLEDDRWVLRYAHGLSEEVIGGCLGRDEIEFSRLNVGENRTITISEGINRCIVERQHIQSVIEVPLITGEEVVGAFSLHYHSPGALFTDLQYDFARKVAASATLALKNARLYEEQIRAEQNFERLSRQYQLILDCAAEGIFGIDTKGIGQFFNRASCEMLGYQPDELLGTRVHELIHHSRPDGTSHLFEQCPIYDTLFRGTNYRMLDEVFWKRDGTSFPVDCTSNPIVEGGAIVGAVMTFKDITQRKQAEQALRKSEERYKYLFQNANDPIFVIDPKLAFIGVNNRAINIFGYTHDEFLQMNILDLFPSEQAPRVRAELKKRERGDSSPMFTGTMLAKSGDYLDVEISSSALREGTRLVGSIHIVRDITEHRKMEEAIRFQATHDILTGLANRVLFMDHLTMSIKQGLRFNETQAVMFLDLDRFKSINDTLGHATGDKLLKAVSERLRGCVRETDTVARIGGDEYNILLNQIAHVDDAAAVAQKILVALNKPFFIEDVELRISISIGISIFPYDGKDAETLLKNADIALYHAKDRGKNTYQFYDAAMNTRTVERVRLENRLRQTVERNELVLFYQPQIETTTGRLVGAEALVHWLHPEMGLLSPMEFIPLAEEIGFITEIDDWVLRTACAQNKAWLDAGYPSFCVTVNVSAKRFRKPGLVETVRNVLQETGLPPKLLELEITETTAMKDIEHTIPSLTRLSGMEVSFAIDDFGTGYSSLSHLKRLPIQKLKIDKSFIFGVTTDPSDKAIVTAIIAMAHNMRMEVIAEGVETEAQLGFLHDNRCDQIQGFLFSRPIPAEEFSRFMQ